LNDIPQWATGATIGEKASPSSTDRSSSIQEITAEDFLDFTTNKRKERSSCETRDDATSSKTPMWTSSKMGIQNQLREEASFPSYRPMPLVTESGKFLSQGTRTRSGK
jgi:hypothetical protein